MKGDLKDEIVKVIREFRKADRLVDGGSKSGDERWLAAHCLYRHMSFRLPESAERDRLIGFRTVVRVIRRFRKGAAHIRPLDAKSPSLVIGGSMLNSSLVTDYITRSSGENLGVYIAKDHIASGRSDWLSLTIRLLPFALVNSFRCLWDRHRACRAQTISEVVEQAWIRDYIKTHKITRVYDFIPYEKDSNILTLQLRELGVDVTKIPSSGPLATHNKILISDRVVFSTEYHFEEHRIFSETIRCGEVLFWPPEKAFTYIHHYLPRPKTPPGTIGFYSHGEWVRRAEGHGQHGLDVLGTEDRILRDMAAFLTTNPERRLIIFAHPREKHPEWIERTRSHYAEYFQGLNYCIADPGINTTHTFHHVDIAVVSYSAIIFERLFCGYKLLIGNHGIPQFPIEGSPLKNICFQSGNDLARLLNECNEWSNSQFYENYGLLGYRYLDHPELKGLSQA